MRKSQRNRIYVRTLKLLKHDLKNEEIHRTGLCCHLKDAMYDVDSFYYSTVDPYLELKKSVEESQFPEIVKHRPESFEIMSYWFRRNDEGIQKRIQIVEQAIEETKKIKRYEKECTEQNLQGCITINEK